MAEPMARQWEDVQLVETVLQAVYGRGSELVELACDLSLDRRSRYPEKVLGTHASDCQLGEVTVVTGPDGGKRARVSGSVEVVAWCKGQGTTFVIGQRVPFVREVAVGPGDGAEYRNERASVTLVREPSCGPGSIVKEGEELCVRVPVYVELAAEIVGERRVLAYVRNGPAAAERSEPSPFDRVWSGADEHDYD